MKSTWVPPFVASVAAKAGLPAELAMRLARATIEGAGELLFRDQETEASTLRRNVTSPGGTTAAALDRAVKAPRGTGSWSLSSAPSSPLP